MTKAIIFDCFGVLTTDGWTPFKKKYFGHDRVLEAQAIDLNKQANAGMIGVDEFVEAIAGLARVDRRDVLWALTRNVPNDELFEYIEISLKPEYKIGLLSNAGGNMLGELFAPERTALFDVIALSYETGHVKPDARAYVGAAEKLGVKTAECVFVDDQERHCEGARSAGMRAVVYSDFEQFQKELEEMIA